MGNSIVYLGDIIAKPRMTRSDKWKHRKVVDNYFKMKDNLTDLAKENNFVLGDEIRLIFGMPVSKSWSNTKKNIADGLPHKFKPDLDNLCKSVMDCLLKNDQNVYKIIAIKKWSLYPYIIIENLD